jgi:hypothetical protein
MHHVDLTMIDASQTLGLTSTWSTTRVNWLTGYTPMTAQAGLEIFMPDLDEQVRKDASQSITVEWLKDRS